MCALLPGSYSGAVATEPACLLAMVAARHAGGECPEMTAGLVPEAFRPDTAGLRRSQRFPLEPVIAISQAVLDRCPCSASYGSVVVPV